MDQVRWTRDGEEVDDYNPFEYVIDHVSYEHNGSYKCQIANDHGFSNSSNSIVLNVNYNPFCKCVLTGALLYAFKKKQCHKTWSLISLHIQFLFLKNINVSGYLLRLHDTRPDVPCQIVLYLF